MQKTQSEEKQETKIKPCADCAGNPINHKMAYSGALMTCVMRPFEKYLGFVGDIVDPLLSKLWNPVAPRFYELLASSNWGKVFEEPSEKDSWKIRCMWEEAQKRGVKMKKICLLKNAQSQSKGTYWAEFNGKVSCFDGLPRPNGPTSKALVWMDDKGLMRKRFREAGVPVAMGGVAMTEKGALKIFRSLNRPVITKPNLGSRSRHTTIHITTEKEFLKAFAIAKQLSPWVVIEEELRGMVFRGTIIGGKVAAVMRREPPHVIGDGSLTVLELAKKENENPKRRGPIFHEIEIGKDAEEDLALQDLSWKSIPGKGRLVTLGQKVGRTTGASTTDVTKIIHPENRKLLEKVYGILKDPLIGVDFIIDDITKPWQEQEKSGVIECNSMPFIDLHHFPLYGDVQNVAGTLWNLIFPESSPPNTLNPRSEQV